MGKAQLGMSNCITTHSKPPTPDVGNRASLVSEWSHPSCLRRCRCLPLRPLRILGAPTSTRQTSSRCPTSLCSRPTVPPLAHKNSRSLHHLASQQSTHLRHTLIKLVNCTVRLVRGLLAPLLEPLLRVRLVLLEVLVCLVDLAARVFHEVVGFGAEVGGGDLCVLFGFVGAAGEAVLYVVGDLGRVGWRGEGSVSFRL